MAEKAKSHIPVGMHTISAHLWFNGNCRDAIDFYKKALNADKIYLESIPTQDGIIVRHAMLKIGNSMILMADTRPGIWERGPKDHSTMGIFMYVEDCDKASKQAIDNGAEEISKVTDMFWGDRIGKFKDPFGHCWTIATHLWDYSPQEMKIKEQEMMAQLNKDN